MTQSSNPFMPGYVAPTRVTMMNANTPGIVRQATASQIPQSVDGLAAQRVKEIDINANLKKQENNQWKAIDSLGVDTSGLTPVALRHLRDETPNLQGLIDSGDVNSVQQLVNSVKGWQRPRSGFFGTGLSLSPMTLGLGALGLGAAGAGLFGGAGVAGSSGTTLGTTGVTQALATPAFGGTAASAAASGVAGGSIGALSGTGLLGTLGGYAPAIAGTSLGSNVIGKSSWLDKLSKLKNIPSGGSPQQQNQQPTYNLPATPFNPISITGGNPVYSPTKRFNNPIYSYAPTQFKTGFNNSKFYNPYRGANA